MRYEKTDAVAAPPGPSTARLLAALMRKKLDVELLTHLWNMKHHGVDPECPELKICLDEVKSRRLNEEL